MATNKSLNWIGWTGFQLVWNWSQVGYDLGLFITYNIKDDKCVTQVCVDIHDSLNHYFTQNTNFCEHKRRYFIFIFIYFEWTSMGSSAVLDPNDFHWIDKNSFILISVEEKKWTWGRVNNENIYICRLPIF